MAKPDDLSQQAAVLRAALKSFLKCNAPSEWLRTRDLLSLLALQARLGSAGDRYLD